MVKRTVFENLFGLQTVMIYKIILKIYFSLKKLLTTPNEEIMIMVKYFKLEEAMKYICELCGYVYKPERGDVDNGVQPGTDFEDISEEWTCPLCGATKVDFEPVDSSDADESDF